MAEWPNRRPESRHFGRQAHRCGIAGLGMRQGRGAQPRRFSGQTLRARFAGTSAAKLGWPRRQGFQGKVAAVRLQQFLKVLRGGAFCQDGEA